MAYILNKTTGQILVTIPDGQGDGPDINPGLNSSDLDLFGKNYPVYGQLLNENFVKLLQNFAATIPPTTPLQGELWYDISDSSNQVLRVYSGTSWTPVTPVWSANTAPATSQIGAQWWDETNQQLNMYNGSGWTLVGPSFKATDGKSGPFVEDVTDTNSATHTVTKFYSNDNVSLIVSYDQAFTLSTDSAVTGFSVISPGITLSSEANNLLYGTAVNAQQLGNIVAANYARNDIDSTFYGNVAVGGGNLVISALHGNPGTAKFYNTVPNGNISFHSNLSGLTTSLLHINGTTGEVTTAQNPLTALGVVTKQYSDNSVATATAPLAPLYSPVLSGIPLAPNVISYTATTGQIATMQSVWGAIGSALTNAAVTGSLTVTANSIPAFTVSTNGEVSVASDPANAMDVATKQYVDNTASSIEGLYATLASPRFTGAPLAPTASSPATNTPQIATTAFVHNAIANDVPPYLVNSALTTTSSDGLTVTNSSNTVVLGVNDTGEVYVSANPTNAMDVATKQYVDTATTSIQNLYAPLDSPALTGTPTSVTPSPGTNTTEIATTAFVQTTVATSTSALWMGSQRFISNLAPTSSQGNNGDFWFQI
jgi:hypothetical protein